MSEKIEAPMTMPAPWAVVTGAGSGIGAALAIELAARGCRPILVGRRAAALETTRHRLPDPQAAMCAPCDLTSAPERERLIDQVTAGIADEGGELRYLVHNAGTGPPSPDFAGMAPRDLEQALAVNVIAPLVLTQGWLPVLREACTPTRIMLTGAGIADRAQPGTGTYGISKKAQQRLFEQMLMDFATGTGATPQVALFRPGLVDTEGLREHCRFARECGLPHVDYLDGALTAGEAWSAEAVARAMTRALLDAGENAFHGQVLRTSDWQA